jgi:hypothetical protein
MPKPRKIPSKQSSAGRVSQVRSGAERTNKLGSSQPKAKVVAIDGGHRVFQLASAPTHETQSEYQERQKKSKLNSGKKPSKRPKACGRRSGKVESPA